MPQDANKGRRRERRLQAAQSLLQGNGEEGGFGRGGKDNGFDLVDNPQGIQPRSQTDDASSQLFAPKWRRLLRAVAQKLAQRCLVEESVSELPGEAADKLRLTFTHGDAIGGGSEEDVMQCLTRFMEVMELSDADVGFTLLSTYQFLQAQDLPFGTQTWRPLLVTAVLVAMDTVCNNSMESQRAATRIQKHVAHWWPQDKAALGLHAFKNREYFKPVSKAEIAKLYFELRDTGLRKDIGDEGDSNASVVAVFLAEVSGIPPGMQAGGSNSRTLGLKDAMRGKGVQRRVVRSGQTPDEDSMNYSDTQSFSFSEEQLGVAAGSSRKSKKDIVSL